MFKWPDLRDRCLPIGVGGGPYLVVVCPSFPNENA